MLRPIRSISFLRQTVLLTAGLLVASAGLDPAVAQFGGRGSGSFLDRYDQNGDRTLDPNELQQIQGPFRGFIESAGVDLSRSVSLDELSERMRRRGEEMRAERERGFGGSGNGENRDGGFRGRDFPARDSDGESSRSEEYGRGRRDFRGNERGSSSGFSESRNVNGRAMSPGTPPKTLIQHPRTTVQLPSQYAPGDTDRDGQLSLAEWRAWKGRAGLAEFHRLDRDGDGFVTPRELQLGPAASGTSAAIVSAAAQSPIAGTVTTDLPSGQAAAAGGSAPVTAVSASSTPVPAGTTPAKVQATDDSDGDKSEFDDPTSAP